MVTVAFLQIFSTSNGFDKKRLGVENVILSIILGKLVVVYFRISGILESMINSERLL